MAQSDVQYEGVEEAVSSIKTFTSHQCQLLASAGFPGPTLFAWPQVSTLTLDLILHLFTSPQTRFFLGAPLAPELPNSYLYSPFPALHPY